MNIFLWLIKIKVVITYFLGWSMGLGLGAVVVVEVSLVGCPLVRNP